MKRELSCGECRDNLLEFIAGVLAEAGREAMERHLATCADCQREAAFWQAVGDGVHSRGQRVPIDGGVGLGWSRLNAVHAAERAGTGGTGVGVMETAEHSADEARDDEENERTVGRDAPLEKDAQAGQASGMPPRRRLPHIWYRVVPTVAALLLVALGVALFGPLRPGQQQQQQQPGPRLQRASCAVSQISAEARPLTAFINDMTMVSPDEGWMVGSENSATAQHPDNRKAAIWHYAHCRWAHVALPPLGFDLYSLTMISPDEGWALGTPMETIGPNGTLSQQSAVLHYAHGQWKVDALPIAPTLPGIGPKTDVGYYKLRMVSPTEGWLIATPLVNGSDVHFDVFHGHNGRWERVTLPASATFAYDVVPVAANEAWIASVAPGGPAYHLVHYLGGAVTDAYTLPEHSGLDWPIYMNSPHDGWLSGVVGDDTSGPTASTRLLLHYDGTHWQKVTLAGEASQGTFAAMRIFGAHDGWAFEGESDGSPHPYECLSYHLYPSYDRSSITGTLHLTDHGWQRVPWGLSNVGCITNLTPSGLDDYWALGTRFGQTSSETVLLHYAEGQWRMYGDTPMYGETPQP